MTRRNRRNNGSGWDNDSKGGQNSPIRAGTQAITQQTGRGRADNRQTNYTYSQKPMARLLKFNGESLSTDNWKNKIWYIHKYNR